MPRAIGANCRLLMIPEATYGTAPSGDWLRMPFLSCDLGAEQPLLDADVIGVGSSRERTKIGIPQSDRSNCFTRVRQ